MTDRENLLKNTKKLKDTLIEYLCTTKIESSELTHGEVLIFRATRDKACKALDMVIVQYELFDKKT